MYAGVDDAVGSIIFTLDRRGRMFMSNFDEGLVYWAGLFCIDKEGANLLFGIRGNNPLKYVADNV